MIPYKNNLKLTAREMRRKPTTAEYYLWQKLLSRDQLLGYRFLRQKPIDRFMVDFYCYKLRLVIEVDGEYHNENIVQDKIRVQILMEKYGLTVLRFTNEQVLNQIDWVHQKIIETIPLSFLKKGARG